MNSIEEDAANKMNSIEDAESEKFSAAVRRLKSLVEKKESGQTATIFKLAGAILAPVAYLSFCSATGERVSLPYVFLGVSACLLFDSVAIVATFASVPVIGYSICVGLKSLFSNFK